MFNFIKESKFLLIPWIVMYAIIITLAIIVSPVAIIPLLLVTLLFWGWIKDDFPTDLTGPAIVTTLATTIIALFVHFKPEIENFLRNL